MMNAEPDTDSWSLPLLRELEWKRFETLCARVFEKIGYDVWTTDLRSDGEFSLIVSSPNPADGGEQTGVCCKSFEGKVTDLEAIHELKETVESRGFGNGIFITAGDFSPQAREFAGQRPELILIDGRELLTKLIGLPKETRREILEAATSGDYTTPTCPSCGLMMLRRAASKVGATGREFWACPDMGPQSCRQTFPVRDGTEETVPHPVEEESVKKKKRRIPGPAAIKPSLSLRDLMTRRFGLQRRSDTPS